MTTAAARGEARRAREGLADRHPRHEARRLAADPDRAGRRHPRPRQRHGHQLAADVRAADHVRELHDDLERDRRSQARTSAPALQVPGDARLVAAVGARADRARRHLPGARGRRVHARFSADRVGARSAVTCSAPAVVLDRAADPGACTGSCTGALAGPPVTPGSLPGMPAPLVVVDGPFLLYRSFFALPDSIKGVDSRPVNALLGGANVLLRFTADRSPARGRRLLRGRGGRLPRRAVPALSRRPPAGARRAPVAVRSRGRVLRRVRLEQRGRRRGSRPTTCSARSRRSRPPPVGGRRS